MRALLVALALVAGCATAQQDTMIAELALGKALSLGYRTVDGIDQVKTSALHKQIEAGQVASAAKDYAAYRVRVSKALSALNAAEDTLEAADHARDAASKAAGDWKAFEAYEPALLSAAAAIQQAIADLKGAGL